MKGLGPHGSGPGKGEQTMSTLSSIAFAVTARERTLVYEIPPHKTADLMVGDGPEAV